MPRWLTAALALTGSLAAVGCERPATGFPDATEAAVLGREVAGLAEELSVLAETRPPDAGMRREDLWTRAVRTRDDVARRLRPRVPGRAELHAAAELVARAASPSIQRHESMTAVDEAAEHLRGALEALEAAVGTRTGTWALQGLEEKLARL